MNHLIQSYLPWLMSAVTIFTMWAAGDKNPVTWRVGLLNQVLWLIWIFSMKAWGLLPMTIAIIFVYARNHRKWKANQA